MKRSFIHIDTNPSQRLNKRKTANKVEEEEEEEETQPIPFYFSVTWPGSLTGTPFVQHYKWISPSFAMSVLVPYFLVAGRRNELHVDVVHALLSLPGSGTSGTFMTLEKMLVVFRQAMARAVTDYGEDNGITTNGPPINSIRREVTPANLGRVFRITEPALIQRLPFTPCYVIPDDTEEEEDESDYDECRSGETISSDGDDETSSIDSFLSITDDESSDDTSSNSSSSSDTDIDDCDDDYEDDSNAVNVVDLIRTMRSVIIMLEKKFDLKK